MELVMDHTTFERHRRTLDPEGEMEFAQDANALMSLITGEARGRVRMIVTPLLEDQERKQLLGAIKHPTIAAVVPRTLRVDGRAIPYDLTMVT